MMSVGQCLIALQNLVMNTDMMVNLARMIELKKINRNIEKQIKKDKKENTKLIKILILGAAESGKSTFLKHMRLNNGAGFSQQERNEAIDTILSNIAVCIYVILFQRDQKIINEDMMQLNTHTKHLSACLSSREECEVAFYMSSVASQEQEEKKVKLFDICEELNIWDVRKLRSKILWNIWQNIEFTYTLLSLGRVNLPDSTLYFLSNFERILRDGYIPTNQDMLFMKKSTTGLYETSIKFQGHRFRMVEVGGQRSERRKWIHCFEDVDSTIFLASLSEYDLNLFEDCQINRLKESIALFRTLLKTNIFLKKKILLFLNKVDIFDAKIRHKDIKECFNDYDGKKFCREDAKQFILDKFLQHGNSCR